MHNLHLVALFGVAFAVCTLSVPVMEDGGGTLAMVYIGSVEGKSYFIDNSPRNWIDANKTCQESGMRIARITSAAQETFLQSARNSSTLYTRYWLGARDSLDLRQLVWDVDRTSLNISQLLPFHNELSMNGCLMYSTGPNTATLFLSLCNSKHKTLCEMVHENKKD